MLTSYQELFNSAEGHQWAGLEQETAVQNKSGQILPSAILSPAVEEVLLSIC